MKPNKDQIEAYKEMAKTSPDSMKAKIEANLKATCDKYAGHEDKLDDCIGKVIDRDCLLVFIRQQGKPVATAELDRNGKVVQFYGDESVHDYDLMKPSAESKEALNKWIKEYRPRIRKVKEAA